MAGPHLTSCGPPPFAIQFCPCLDAMGAARWEHGVESGQAFSINMLDFASRAQFGLYIFRTCTPRPKKDTPGIIETQHPAILRYVRGKAVSWIGMRFVRTKFCTPFQAFAPTFPLPQTHPVTFVEASVPGLSIIQKGTSRRRDRTSSHGL